MRSLATLALAADCSGLPVVSQTQASPSPPSAPTELKVIAVAETLLAERGGLLAAAAAAGR